MMSSLVGEGAPKAYFEIRIALVALVAGSTRRAVYQFTKLIFDRRVANTEDLVANAIQFVTTISLSLHLETSLCGRMQERDSLHARLKL